MRNRIKCFGMLSGGLADARERLARIEGHLRIVPPPRQDASDGDPKAT